jgi:hypothetical protein
MFLVQRFSYVLLGSAPQNRPPPAVAVAMAPGSWARCPGSISSATMLLLHSNASPNGSSEQTTKPHPRRSPQSHPSCSHDPEELYKIIEDDNVLRSLFHDMGIITRDQND